MRWPRLSADATDRAAAVVLLGVAVYVLVEAARMPAATGPAPGPGLVPGVLGATLAGVAMTLWVASRRERPADPSPIVLGHAHGVTVLVGLGLVALLLERLGFGLTLGGLLLILFRRLSGRGWVWSAVLAGLTVAAALVVFERLLGMPLPRGSWWD